jgi:uncharacterized protein
VSHKLHHIYPLEYFRAFRLFRGKTDFFQGLCATLPLKFNSGNYHWFDASAVSIYHYQVMLYRLPEFIDPLHLADKQGEIKGQIAVSDLDRLGDLLISDTEAVTVALYFGREGRIPFIEGRIQAVLQLQCQNCLQAVTWPVDSTFKLGIVTTIEQVNRLPESFEPLLVTEAAVRLKDIIEDELLLTLPDYPKHQHNCLALHTEIKHSDVSPKTEQSHKKNPFSILANLKNTGES